jgi:hypothetical protein
LFNFNHGAFAQPYIEIFAQNSGETLIQDPYELREAVFPIFGYDIYKDEVHGHGTGFKIDPLSTGLSAHHVFEDFLEIEDTEATPSASVLHGYGFLGLESPGIVYGKAKIQNDLWSQIVSLNTIFRHSKDPFVPVSSNNFCEVMRFHLRKRHDKPPKFLKANLRDRPAEGEELLALGFANMRVDGRPRSHEDILTISSNLFGVVGKVVEHRPPDPNSSRPWPVFYVDQECSPGMSGGPVLNKNFEVVGIVSNSISGSKIYSAVSLTSWGVYPSLLPHIDPLNVGNFIGYGYFEGDSLRNFCFEGQTTPWKLKKSDLVRRPISWRFGTDEFMTL